MLSDAQRGMLDEVLAAGNAELARLRAEVTQLTEALARERTRDPHPALMLAAYLAFIRGVDIPETIEAGRAALVERCLRAEAEVTRVKALEYLQRGQADGAKRLLGRVLDSHAPTCRCACCQDIRHWLGKIRQDGTW